jgi:hypothetical protein
MNWFEMDLGPVRQAFDRWHGLAEFSELFRSGSPPASEVYKRIAGDGTVTIYIRSSSRNFPTFVGAVRCSDQNPSELDLLLDN